MPVCIAPARSAAKVTVGPRRSNEVPSSTSVKENAVATGFVASLRITRSCRPNRLHRRLTINQPRIWKCRWLVLKEVMAP